MQQEQALKLTELMRKILYGFVPYSSTTRYELLAELRILESEISTPTQTDKGGE